MKDGNEYFPLITARSFSRQDERLNLWLRQIQKISRGASDPFAAEKLLDELDQIMDGTKLSALCLAKVAAALTEQHGSLEQEASLRIFSAAVPKAQAELAAAGNIDPDLNPAVIALRMTIEPLGKHSRWETLERVYAMLSQYEADNTQEQYRARLKHADMFLMTGDPAQGLKILDALIADVQLGNYPTANRRDIGSLHWSLCKAAGRIDNGISYLRQGAADSRGTPDAERMMRMFVRALLDAGRIEEARQQYAAWTVAYSKVVSQDVAADLQNELRTASWREEHLRN